MHQQQSIGIIIGRCRTTKENQATENSLTNYSILIQFCHGQPIVRSALAPTVGSPFASFSAIVIFRILMHEFTIRPKILFQLAAQQVDGINVKLKSNQHEREDCVSNNRPKKKKTWKRMGKVQSHVRGWAMGHLSHTLNSHTQQPFWHRIGAYARSWCVPSVMLSIDY